MSEENIQNAKPKAKKRKLFIGLIIGIAAVALAAGVVVPLTVINNKNAQDYTSAVQNMETGKYEEAKGVFQTLKGYKDAKAKVDVCDGLISLRKAALQGDLNIATAAISNIVNAGEKVKISYFDEKAVSSPNTLMAFSDGAQYEQTVEKPNFKYVTPNNVPGYSFNTWLPKKVTYKESLTRLQLDAVRDTDYYSILYSLDGGTNNELNPEGYTIETETITLRDPFKTGYHFLGWWTAPGGGTEVFEIPKGSTGSIVLYARWLLQEFTVNFYNYDNTLLDTQKVKYGQTAVYGGITPTRPSTAQYDYIFTGWDHVLTNVISNINTTASYSTKTKQYTVSFYSRGVLLCQTTVDYGSTAVPTVVPQEKEIINKVAYYFTGWDKDISNVQGDMAVNATFETKNIYDVQFVNYDNTALYSTEVEHGDTAVYVGANPSRENTAQYTYTWTGWDGELTNITKNTTFKATYSFVTNKYNVNFVNYDLTVLETKQLEYGAHPTYTGETPVRPDTYDTTYQFNGWGVDLTTYVVTGEVTFVAQYISSPRLYTVTFKGYNEEVLDVQTTTYGGSVTYGGVNPTRDSDEMYNYYFNDWDKSLTHVTEDITTHPTWISRRYYLVTFHDFDETVLYVDKPEAGQSASYSGTITPSKPQTDIHYYTWTGWDKNLSEVYSDLDVYPTFDENLRSFAVTFKNYDGSILFVDNVVAYMSAEYEGETPTKTSNNGKGFEFNNKWTLTNGGNDYFDLTNITEDMTVYASFDDVYYENVFGCKYSTMFLTSNGKCYFAGEKAVSNEKSQNEYVNTAYEVNVENVGKIVDASLYEGYAIVLNEDGEVYSMGYNYTGCLGLGHNDFVSEFTKVTFPDNVKIIQVRAFNATTLFLAEDGSVYGAGWNNGNMLAPEPTSTYFTTYTPIKLEFLSPLKFVKIATNSSLAIGLTADGKLYGWGKNYFGEMGAGGSYTRVTVGDPVQITYSVDPSVKFVDVKLETTYMTCIDENGNLYAAGDRNPLFDYDTFIYVNYPAIVKLCFITDKKIVKYVSNDMGGALVLTEGNFVYAIAQANSLYTHGEDNYKPVLIEELPNTVAVANSGYAYYCLTDDHLLHVIGINNYGTMGDSAYEIDAELYEFHTLSYPA